MAKRRCPYERASFDTTEFVERDGFLVHIGADTTTPLEPPHEAIEGRRLVLTATKKYTLHASENVELRTDLADNAPPA